MFSSSSATSTRLTRSRQRLRHGSGSLPPVDRRRRRPSRGRGGRGRRQPAGRGRQRPGGGGGSAGPASAAACGLGRAGGLRVAGVDVGLDRQQHRERRALARLRAHLDGAAVVLDDALADRQPQPGPLLLGREERDEQVLEVAGRDADAGVAETDLQERRRGAAAGRRAAARSRSTACPRWASPAARSATGSGTPAGAARRRRAPAASCRRSRSTISTLPCSSASLANSASVFLSTSATSSWRCSPR